MTDSEDRFFPSTFLTPAEIYHQVTQGPGLFDLQRIQAQVQHEVPEEEDRANLIASLGDLIAVGWQGAASAAARGAALPLKEQVLANADKLDQAQDLVSRQAGSFERAHNSVRPVSEPPEQSLDDAFPFDVDHEKEVTAYQADAQHNIAVFQQYDGASEYNETNMPQEFHAGGRDGGDISVKSADTIGVGEPRPGPGDGPPGGPGDEPGNPDGGYRAGPSGYPGEAAGHPGASAGVTGASSSGDGQTAANDYRSSSGSLYPTTGYSPPLSGAPVSAAPGGFVGGGSVGGYSGGGAPRAGGGVAGGGGGSAVRGPGGAVGAGALAAEENAVRRGMQGAAARGGAGPMGAPLGAGRGKDDENAEHERKVLIEADAEQIFGSDVLTAPQVIGDDEYED
ncbi:MAG: hypothetical protein WBA97_24090 [Actinophytocola sp.]|uniref:hypothetical protein n=1 Tax=Actinophytocola sp. TaxID=1872138 RepID=UPI003C79378E